MPYVAVAEIGRAVLEAPASGSSAVRTWVASGAVSAATWLSSSSSPHVWATKRTRGSCTPWVDETRTPEELRRTGMAFVRISDQYERARHWCIEAGAPSCNDA